MTREMSVTIKPTLSCNMRCKHCFNGEMVNKPEIVSTDTVNRFLTLVAEKYNDIAITFHGGEPTLAGYDFYKTVLEHIAFCEKEYGCEFHINITTNGLMLSDELIDLLIANNVRANVSFDGPCNDILRQNTEAVYANLLKLQEKGADLRVYCTITSKSLSRLFETYEWFRNHRIDFKFIPIQPQGNAKQNNYLVSDPDELVKYLVELYSHWLKDTEAPVKCFTFSEFVELSYESAFKDHWFNRKLALNPDGKIYPFGRPNDVNFCLGAPEEIEDIDQCFDSPNYEKLIATLNKYRSEFCGDCSSKSVCNGITICSSFVYGDDYDMLKYGCTLSDKIFAAVISQNKKVLDDFRNGKGNCYNKTAVKFYNSKL